MKTETLLALMVLLPAATFGQSSTVTLPQGTQLPVETPVRLPMRAGTPIRGELLYPVYAGNRLVLPSKTILTGTIVSLAPDHHRRVDGRLHFDFTPFRTPVVRFDAVTLPSGETLAITTGTATDGAPIYRLVAPPPRKGGIIRRAYEDAVKALSDDIKIVTGPDKGDRFVQFVYSQLPYHPQRVMKGTAWTVEMSAPLNFTEAAAPKPDLPSPSVEQPVWILQAYLDTAMSSETSKPGQPIRATVAEPIYNPDGTVAVPQGSFLTGTVTAARPARKLSRAGTLRFTFRELTRPGEQAQSVRVALKGADSSRDGDLAMDSEGNVKPKPQDKLAVPLILLSLAARPLDQHEGRMHHQLGKDAVASNSLGSIGLIIGTAAGQPNIAAGIGFYGAALSIYQRIFAKGKPVAFAKDTRVVLQTSARSGQTSMPTEPLKP